MTEESGMAVLLVIAVIPAVVLNVIAALTAPPATSKRPGRFTAVAEEPLKHGFPYMLCRMIGHRRREEAPGIYFCPRCGGALIGRSRRQR